MHPPPHMRVHPPPHMCNLHGTQTEAGLLLRPLFVRPGYEWILADGWRGGLSVASGLW